MKGTPASFSLLNYRIIEAELKIPKEEGNIPISSGFSPSGVFYPESGIFELTFKVIIYKLENPSDYILKATVLSEFKFVEKINFEEIPAYFYKNIIAIIFPYVRSFVSMISSQGNNNAMILPVLNLSNLEKPLRENTIISSLKSPETTSGSVLPPA